MKRPTGGGVGKEEADRGSEGLKPKALLAMILNQGA
jgi:hypothetical protein